MATGLENELLNEKPWYSKLYDNTFRNTIDKIGDRWTEDNFSDSFKEGNYSRGALRLAGAAGGTFGDILGAPLDLVFEATGINNGLDKLIKKGLDTETGQKLYNLAKDNPEYAADIGAFLDTVSALPAGKLLKNSINDVFHNLETKVEGGRLGEYLHKKRVEAAEKAGLPPPEKPNFYNSFSPPLVGMGIIDSTASSLKDRFSPTQVATTRASGIPTGKREELAKVLKEGTFNDAAAVALAAQTLQKQRYGTGPAIMDNLSPINRYNYAGMDIPIEDTETLTRLMGGSEIPDEVVQKHIRELRQAVADPKSKRPTTVDVINPNARNIHTEFANQPMGMSPMSTINKVFRDANIQKLPADLTIFELAKAAKTVDNLKSKPSMKELGKAPFRKLQGKTALDRPDPLKMSGGVQGVDDVLNAVRKKAAGEKLTERQEQLVRAYNKAKVNPAEGLFQHVNSSHVSAVKELGGVHDMFSFLDGDTMFSSIQDAHDLFGRTFIGAAKDKVATTPIAKRVLGKESETTARRNERYPAKDDIGSFIKPEQLKKIEDISGVSRKPKENVVDYQLRAIAEMQRKPELRDYAQVLKNSLMTAVGTPVLIGGNNQYEER